MEYDRCGIDDSPPPGGAGQARKAGIINPPSPPLRTGLPQWVLRDWHPQERGQVPQGGGSKPLSLVGRTEGMTLSGRGQADEQSGGAGTGPAGMRDRQEDGDYKSSFVSAQDRPSSKEEERGQVPQGCGSKPSPRLAQRRSVIQRFLDTGINLVQLPLNLVPLGVIFLQHIGERSSQ
jgi:hypothetical protein